MFLDNKETFLTTPFSMLHCMSIDYCLMINEDFSNKRYNISCVQKLLSRKFVQFHHDKIKLKRITCTLKYDKISLKISYVAEISINLNKIVENLRNS